MTRCGRAASTPSDVVEPQPVIHVAGNHAPTMVFLSLKRLGKRVYARFRVCDDASYCDLDTTMTCVSPRPDGEPCTAQEQCEHSCDQDTGTCYTPPICI